MPERVKVSYLPSALRDLEEILDYVRLDSPDRATRLLNKLEREISRLVRFPLLGKVPKDELLARKGYRILVVENYLVFYVASRRSVRIRRVIHGTRRYRFLL